MSCDRFEREGLLRLEQGLPLDDHFLTCPDCVGEQETYQRLSEQIATAGDALEPRPYWQTRVLATIEEREQSRRRRWLWLALPATLAALLLWSLWRPALPIAETQLALAIQVESGGSVRRGEEAHPGDRIRLDAVVGTASHAELRLYREDQELILRCSTESPCLRRGNALEASVELRMIGAYQALVLVSEQPLPDATGQLDSDMAAALSSGARVELGPAIDVR